MNIGFYEKLKECYRDLSIDNHTVDIHGWMDTEFANVFKQELDRHVQTKGPDAELCIVEVGSWKGLSTTSMARICKENNIKARILAIDTWLGAPEFWTHFINDPTRGGSLNLVNGYPTVYYTFVKNVKALGHDDIIVPLPLSSICAADVLRYYGIRPDIIYIDAAHEYESVIQDMYAYYQYLNVDGMMFGDDYCSAWPGVMKAVDEFTTTKDIQFNLNGVVWSLHKN